MKALVKAVALTALIAATIPGCALFHGIAGGDGDEKVLTVFAMDDFHGSLRPQKVDGKEVGGVDWIAGYLEALRKANPGGVIAVDTGDAFTGPLVTSHSEGAVVIDFYNILGLDAMAIGNHEFDYGPVGPLNLSPDKDSDPRGALKERAKQAKFPLLTANIFETATGERFAPEGIAPYTIVEKKGVKVDIKKIRKAEFKVTLRFSTNVDKNTQHIYDESCIQRNRLILFNFLMFSY